MHIYTTHILKLGTDQRREKEGVVILVIYTLDMHINTTHQLKLGKDQRREKEGVVIPIHLHIRHTHLRNSPPTVGNDQREKEGVVIPSQLNLICKSLLLTS